MAYETCPLGRQAGRQREKDEGSHAGRQGDVRGRRQGETSGGDIRGRRQGETSGGDVRGDVGGEGACVMGCGSRRGGGGGGAKGGSVAGKRVQK